MSINSTAKQLIDDGYTRKDAFFVAKLHKKHPDRAIRATLGMAFKPFVGLKKNADTFEKISIAASNVAEKMAIFIEQTQKITMNIEITNKNDIERFISALLHSEVPYCRHDG